MSRAPHIFDLRSLITDGEDPEVMYKHSAYLLLK